MSLLSWVPPRPGPRKKGPASAKFFPYWVLRVQNSVTSFGVDNTRGGKICPLRIPGVFSASRRKFGTLFASRPRNGARSEYDNVQFLRAVDPDRKRQLDVCRPAGPRDQGNVRRRVLREGGEAVVQRGENPFAGNDRHVVRRQQARLDRPPAGAYTDQASRLGDGPVHLFHGRRCPRIIRRATWQGRRRRLFLIRQPRTEHRIGTGHDLGQDAAQVRGVGNGMRSRNLRKRSVRGIRTGHTSTHAPQSVDASTRGWDLAIKLRE